MSRYSIVRREGDLMIIRSSQLGVQPMIIARLTPEVPISMPKAYVDFVSHLENLLTPTTSRAEFDIGQRLITEEEFRQALALREDRLRIQRVMELVAVNKRLTVVIGSNDYPELSDSAMRGVLGKLMDDFAHNGNAIRKLGFEPAAIEKSIAEAVEAVLVVFLEAGATE